MRFSLSSAVMVFAISDSAISDISLVAKPRVFITSTELKFIMILKSSSLKYIEVSSPRRSIIM